MPRITEQHLGFLQGKATIFCSYANCDSQRSRQELFLLCARLVRPHLALVTLTLQNYRENDRQVLKEGQWGWSPLPGRRDSVIGTGSVRAGMAAGHTAASSAPLAGWRRYSCAFHSSVSWGFERQQRKMKYQRLRMEIRKRFFFFFSPAEQLGGTQAQRRLDYLLCWGFCSWAGWSPEQPGLGLQMSLFGAGVLRFQDCQYEWASGGVVYRETHCTADLLLWLCL